MVKVKGVKNRDEKRRPEPQVIMMQVCNRLWNLDVEKRENSATHAHGYVCTVLRLDVVGGYCDAVFRLYSCHSVDNLYSGICVWAVMGVNKLVQKSRDLASHVSL